MELSVRSLDELQPAVQQLLKLLPEKRLFAFYAEMGAGKTTFIKAICKELGVIDPVSSPTYSIVNEYHTSTGEKLYHFDFYRLKKPAEAKAIGCDEYFDSGAYCFIEWPEKIGTLLPEGCVAVKIEVAGEIRELFISK